MHKNLDLILVNIFHRHGERSPLKTYEKPLGRLPACTRTNEYSESLPTLKSTFMRPIRSLFTTKNQPLDFKIIYKKLVDGECAPGQLTDHGKRRLYNLGKKLRSDYVDTGFIKENYDREEVHLTSTDFQRTIESLQSLVKGLFRRSDEPVCINVGKRGVKSLYSSNFCTYFLNERKDHKIKVLEMHKENVNTVKKYVDSKYPLLKNTSSIYEIYDIVCSSIGNKTNVFNNFSSKILNIAEKISLDMHFGVLAKPRNLSIYRGEIIRDLHDRIKNVLSNSMERTKMYVLSAHDVTIYPLLMAFGIQDGRWPGFGANLVYETFRDKNGKYFIRVKYNGMVKVIPGCKENFEGDKDYCGIEEFLRICQNYIPKNKEELCRV